MILPVLRKNPLLFFVLGLTAVAAFLRFWNFSDTLMFQGDQGRDALIVSQIFTEHNPVLIGPVTSVGNMYLGPFYYYFMLPFLWLSYPSPLGPAWAMAVLGTLTVPLTYWLGKELVGKRAALIASLITTFSASAIIYSRFSWNPNPAPIVALIMVWATHRAWQKSQWYWLVVAVCFSILLQLHYIAALSAGGAVLVWAWQTWWMAKKKAQSATQNLSKQLLIATIAIGIVIASFLPLVLFDLRHDGLIRQALVGLFTQEKILDKSPSLSLPAKVAAVVKDSQGRAEQILFEHTLGRFDQVNTALLLLVIAILAWHGRQWRKKVDPGLFVILAFLVTGIIGSALYQHSLFDHYIAYLFPIVFLVFGFCLSWLSRQTLFGKVAVVASLLGFIFLNAQRWPLQSQAWTIDDVKATADSVYQHLQPGETYGLVLLSPSKDLYAQNYRYFLSTTDKPPSAPEEAIHAQTLVVINEEHVPNVADLPIYEIVTFPNKTISEVYTIQDGPEIIIYRR